MSAATRAHLGAILDGWVALLAHGQHTDPRLRPAPEARDTLRAWALDHWYGRFHPFPPVLVAERGTVVVGWISGGPLHELPILDRPRAACIHNLWVDPAHRRRGVGRELVRQWCQLARAAGYLHLEVSALAGDTDARAFWVSQGFGPWRVQLAQTVTDPLPAGVQPGMEPST